MKKTLVVVLALIMCFGTANGVLAAGKEFTDVKPGDWFYNDVKTAVELGLVNGKSETTYAPDDNLTYAEAIKLAACMHQRYTEGVVSIKAGNPWYQPYVEYCEENEIITKGYTYSANATRAGYMEIFANSLPDEGLKAINSVADDAIPDVPSSRVYAPGVYKLYRAGILQGVDAEHNCSPRNNIKRSEVAAILTRMMDADKRVKFTLGEETAEKIEKDENAETEVLAITTEPKKATVELGEAAAFSVKATGGKTPYTYQWQYESDSEWMDVTGELGEVEGATDRNLSIIRKDAGTIAIRCVVKDANGEKAISKAVDFITEEAEVAPIKFTKHPTAGSLNVGGTIITTVEVTGGVSPYKYQWMYNDGSGWKAVTDALGTVSGQDTNRVSIKASAEANFDVRCVVTDAEGNEATSDKADFVFNAKEEGLKIIQEPSDATGEVGKSITASVKVTGGTQPYKYLWTMNAGTSWYSLVGAKGVTGAETANLSIVTSGATTMEVRCVITDAKGVKVQSESAELVATPAKEEPKPEVKPTELLKIIKQPENVQVDMGETAVLTVEVTGGAPDYTYQWFYENCTGENALKDVNGSIEGSKTSKLSITRNDAFVVNLVCQITDANGNKIESQKAELYVGPKYYPLEIEIQPVDTTVAAGEDAVISVKAKNGVGKLTYQWQMNIGRSWVSLSENDMIIGTKTDTLTLKSTAASYIDVRCVVKDQSNASVPTNGVRVTFQ